MADKEVKLVDRSHPFYSEVNDLWELYKDAADGGEDFITTDNIFTHRLEDSEDYNERLERAFYLNFCSTIPDMYNSFIFRENINRGPDSLLDGFRENVDGQGTTMSEFVKIAGYWSSVYGVIHAIVDMPITKAVSKADENGIRPFAKLLSPLQVKDWSLDEQGNYNWVLIEYTYYRDLDPKIERTEEKHYKLITKTDWRIEDEEGEQVKFEDGSPSQGTNEFGVVPIVTMYHAEGKPKIGKSLIKDIVYINRIIMNWCSCIDEQVERQTFSQLVLPDDGSLAEESETSDPLTRVGTSSVFTFNSDSRHPPAFISPEARNLSVVWNLVLDLIKEIYRLSGLQGGTSDLYTTRSGKQAQLSFSGVNSSLAAKSEKYEKFENGLSHLAYMQLGKDISSFNRVVYPKTFDVLMLEAELDSYFDIMERGFSTKLNKMLMKNIARRVVPTAPTKDREDIESEIESGSGMVESITKNPVTGGDVGNPNTNLSDTFKSQEKLKDEKNHVKKDGKNVGTI